MAQSLDADLCQSPVQAVKVKIPEGTYDVMLMLCDGKSRWTTARCFSENQLVY